VSESELCAFEVDITTGIIHDLLSELVSLSSFIQLYGIHPKNLLFPEYHLLDLVCYMMSPPVKTIMFINFIVNRQRSSNFENWQGHLKSHPWMFIR